MTGVSTRRLRPGGVWLPAATVAAICVAVVAAALVPAPAGGPPTYALDALLVWRVEIAVVVATAFYAAIVVVLLALHGTTPTRVGLDGVDIPRLDGGERDERRAMQKRLDVLEAAIASTVEGAQHSSGTLHQMKDQGLRDENGGR